MMPASYHQVPAHMLGRPNEWDLDSIPTNVPTMSPMNHTMGAWTEPVYQGASPASSRSRSNTASQSPSAMPQVMANPDPLAGDGRSDAGFNGPIRCWSDRCNGREFSSIGNYRRHFREQHRVSKKFCCQRCGRPFSRSTARNLHYEKRKCRSIQFDENGIPVSLPFPEATDGEAFSPTMDALPTEDESRHASVDSTYPLYMPPSMTYAEPTSQPSSLIARGSRNHDLAAFDGSPLTGWDEPSPTWDDALNWNYLDPAMDVTARAFDRIPPTTAQSWSRSSVMGY